MGRTVYRPEMACAEVVGRVGIPGDSPGAEVDYPARARQSMDPVDNGGRSGARWGRTGGGVSEVFVYGTLLLPDIQRRVTGRTFEAVPARVEGFARRRVRGETYPSLVPDPGASVDGALLHGVDDTSLARLDAYEGEAYERIPVRARCADGNEADASLWLLRASERQRLSDEPWDLAIFVARDLARFEAEYEGFDHVRDDEDHGTG